ncbi:MAG: PHB depolymerase family esterase [Neisseria sp.]|uniref:PHB depolymerase family esterase n=1 Tax=Neisseria sp. TaxID=192066 RepID=UPI0026DD7A0E|nr:PHB depolymerase family esterase [Neisseria sp.]MDO4641198.1 PHB depolymerase family esterase [Neisseria sp.]
MKPTSMITSLLLMALPVAVAHAGIKNVTALSESTPYGQKVTAAAVEYDEPINNSTLSTDSFQVAGRTVTGVYATDRIASASRPKSGKIVMIKLSPDDADAALTVHEGHDPSVERKINLQVSQVKPLKAAKQRVVMPGKAQSSRMVNEIVDDFKQAEFKDPASGVTVKYNLFVPKNYDPKKRYPLVMFIHDAGATNSNVRNALLQGDGATSFASPEFQAKHPAFVLAPQYDHTIVNDNSDDPVDLDPTINLIKQLERQYRIDDKRIYTTGQSGGAMMSIAMNIKYPDFFAASYIVAGQWAPEKTAPMAKNKLFILVSQDDAKAYPGENAITEVLAKHGADVQKAVFADGSNIAQMNEETRRLLAKGGNVHYAAIRSGTLPDQVKDPNSTNKGQAHVGTWKVAYDIAAIRDWLFSQRKP